MRNRILCAGVVAFCAIVMAALFVQTSGLNAEVHRLGGQLAILKAAAPGLGEYMTTIQLHMGKLWYAASAENWKLAQYALGELDETMEAAGREHKVVNGVDIPNVLDAVRETQIPEIREALKRQSLPDFRQAYDETLSACNGCHESAGRQFIHIVRPSGAPVTNQRWRVAAGSREAVRDRSDVDR